jgi:hypothetical protein
MLVTSALWLSYSKYTYFFLSFIQHWPILCTGMHHTQHIALKKRGQDNTYYNVKKRVLHNALATYIVCTDTIQYVHIAIA